MKRGSGARALRISSRGRSVKPPLFAGFGFPVLGSSGLHIFERELERCFVQRGIAYGYAGEVDNPSVRIVTDNVVALIQGLRTSALERPFGLPVEPAKPGGLARNVERAVLLDALEADSGIFGEPLGLSEVKALACRQICMNRRYFNAIQPIATV